MAFRLYTLYNVYTLKPDRINLREHQGRIVVEADKFSWAGLQKATDGYFRAEARRGSDGISIAIEAELEDPIKACGMLVDGLERGRIFSTDWTFKEPKGIHTYSYPHPWLSATRYLPAPLYFIQHADGSYTYAASTDTQVRPKRFRVRVLGGVLHLGLFHEEDARRFSRRMEVPAWLVGRTKDPDKVVKSRMEMMERAWGLKSWDEREDVPEWARNISLVLNLHFKHWTGFAFNTYETAVKVLRWVSERIDGRHILAYLTSWDGRYYYDYPALEPDPELGGREGFRRLVEEAHRLDIHVVPMTSSVAVGFAHAKVLGFRDAVVIDKYGNRLFENWVDWDEDGERDNIWYPINLGHPRVREYFVERISRLVEDYGVDGIFLDISCFYENDPRYSFYEGLRGIIEELQSRYRGRFLVMGECWYDALLPLIPLTHTHTMLPKNWSYFYLKYARMAYHLSWPAPGGSTGVHEAGFLPFTLPDPEREIIPTLSIVHDTIDRYPSEVEKIIEISKEWGARRGILDG